MGYILEDELIQFPNQDNGTPAMPGSYSSIHVSRMMLLAECVSAKSVPDLRQPHTVVHRVYLNQTVAQSTSVA